MEIGKETREEAREDCMRSMDEVEVEEGAVGLVIGRLTGGFFFKKLPCSAPEI